MPRTGLETAMPAAKRPRRQAALVQAATETGNYIK
jgi:hypothetical protein